MAQYSGPLILLPIKRPQNRLEANNATAFWKGISSFGIFVYLFVIQISDPYIIYIQKHSIWYFKNSAEHYVPYKTVQNREYILLKLTIMEDDLWE